MKGGGDDGSVTLDAKITLTPVHHQPIRTAMAGFSGCVTLVGSTLSIVPAQIDNALNGNVLVGADRPGLTLGMEMIIVVLIVMVGYWLVQRRARRWLR